MAGVRNPARILLWPSLRLKIYWRGLTHPLTLSTLLLLLLIACSKPPDAASSAPAEPAKETGLERIPAPDNFKMPSARDLSGWKNPYLVVRDDGIGLVDLENHEIKILKPEEIPAELVSLPISAWPYGRIVLVTQAAPRNPTEEAKAVIRKNRGLLLGTLKELDVQIREYP